MRKVIMVSVLCFSAPAFATADEGELIEVSAPDLSGGDSGVTTIIGGWVGGGTATHGGAASTGAEKSAAGKVKAKEMKEKKKNKKDSKSLMDWLLGVFVPEVEIADQMIDKVTDFWDGFRFSSEEVTYEKESFQRNADGELVPVKEKYGCKQTTATFDAENEKKPTCLEVEIKKFKDPADGKQKQIIQIATLDPRFNPARDDADAKGYVYGYSESFSFVVTSKEEIRAYLTSLRSL